MNKENCALKLVDEIILSMDIYEDDCKDISTDICKFCMYIMRFSTSFTSCD